MAGDGVGVGNGMFDAEPGPVVGAMVGVIVAAVGVSMTDTAVGLSVRGGSSSHADSTEEANKHNSPMPTIR